MSPTVVIDPSPARQPNEDPALEVRTAEARLRAAMLASDVSARRPPDPRHLRFPPLASDSILRNVPPPIATLQSLLSTLAPVRQPGVFVYAVVPTMQRLGAIIPVAMMTEPKGLSVILPEADAAALDLEPHFRCAWITLTVHSDLAAHGLTAAFATALAEARISCNVIAGVYHDHLFVPAAQADEAMAALRALQARAAGELV